jgi:hypothetical protein
MVIDRIEVSLASDDEAVVGKGADCPRHGERSEIDNASCLHYPFAVFKRCGRRDL